MNSVVWLWDASERYTGITDDENEAMESAMSYLKPGDAARVELAIFTLGAGPVGSYIRTGTGWRIVLSRHGPMEWERIPYREESSIAS